MVHVLPIVVTVLLQRDVRWFSLVGFVALVDMVEWMFLTPLLSKWLDTGFIPFALTPVLSHLLTFVPVFEVQVGGLRNI